MQCSNNKTVKDMKYSILMSVYYKENPEYLRISIESMLAQTVKANEFVIVKDGALGWALDQVIQEFSKNNPNLFKIIQLEDNVGLGPALAIGIRECKNEFIARMDSDDFSCPERCEKQLEVFLSDDSYDAVGCFENEFQDSFNNVLSIHRVPELPEDIYYFMKRRCALLHPTVIYKKSTVLKCGNYKNVRLYEDYDLFIRLVIENKGKCYNVQEPLYYIRINDNFFKRRGGISYMNTAIAFKFGQLKKGHMSLKDFIISAGSQTVVCLLPNKLRKLVYIKLLRKS